MRASTTRPSPTMTVQRHPMRVVTLRTGLSAELLRVWERRYSVVAPVRSPSGRRLYSDADIDRLRLLHRGTLGGRTIGELARLSTDALADVVRQDALADQARVDRPSSPDDGPAPERIITDAVRALERMDAVGLEGLLRRAIVALPAATLLDEVIAGFLERVRTRLREGTLRPVHDHLGAVVIRRVLDRFADAATSLSASPAMIVASPAGQLDELGAMLVAAASTAEGWAVTYLGAALPAEDIAEAASAMRARAVVLSVAPPRLRAIPGELRRLASLLPRATALLVAGSGAPAYAPVLEEIGAEPLTDLHALRVRLRTLRQRGRTR